MLLTESVWTDMLRIIFVNANENLKYLWSRLDIQRHMVTNKWILFWTVQDLKNIVIQYTTRSFNRIVSVMFNDMSHSTSWSHNWEPRQTGVILEQYETLIRNKNVFTAKGKLPHNFLKEENIDLWWSKSFREEIQETEPSYRNQLEWRKWLLVVGNTFRTEKQHNCN